MTNIVTNIARKSLILAAFVALLTTHSPARAEEAEACTGSAFTQTADFLYKKQASFYMAAYEQGALDMEAMAWRLESYAEKYEGLDAQFTAFMASRKDGGVDFSKPVNYVRALADFLASVDVDTHMPVMCDTVEELAKPDQAV